MTEKQTDKEELFRYMCIIVDPHHIDAKRRMTITAKSKPDACAYIRKTWPSTESILIPNNGIPAK